MQEQEFTVSGSYGVIIVDRTSGNVISYTPYHTRYDVNDDLYKDITRFDVEEFKSVYGDIPQSVDILDIGCWEGTEYCPPSQNFRNKRSRQCT